MSNDWIDDARRDIQDAARAYLPLEVSTHTENTLSVRKSHGCSTFLEMALYHKYGVIFDKDITGEYIVRKANESMVHENDVNSDDDDDVKDKRGHIVSHYGFNSNEMIIIYLLFIVSMLSVFMLWYTDITSTLKIKELIHNLTKP